MLFWLSKSLSGLGFLGSCARISSSQDTNQIVRNNVFSLLHLVQRSPRFQKMLELLKQGKTRGRSFAALVSSNFYGVKQGTIVRRKNVEQLNSSHSFNSLPNRAFISPSTKTPSIGSATIIRADVGKIADTWLAEQQNSNSQRESDKHRHSKFQLIGKLFWLLNIGQNWKIIRTWM